MERVGERAKEAAGRTEFEGPRKGFPSLPVMGDLGGDGLDGLPPALVSAVSQPVLTLTVTVSVSSLTLTSRQHPSTAASLPQHHQSLENKTTTLTSLQTVNKSPDNCT